MAQLLRQQSRLDFEYKNRMRNGYFFIITTIISFLIFAFNFSHILNALTLLTGIISPIASWCYINDAKPFKKGADGEKKVTDILLKFPIDWYIFNDMIVEKSQIDHIVVCPKGVFTIETKNYSGRISGNSQDKHWKKHYTNENGHVEIPFYSPVKQAKKHSIDLNKYLKKYNYDLWIDTLVVFTGDDFEYDVYSDVPVLQVNELYRFLKRESNVLDNQECENIMLCIYDLIEDQEELIYDNYLNRTISILQDLSAAVWMSSNSFYENTIYPYIKNKFKK